MLDIDITAAVIFGGILISFFIIGGIIQRATKLPLPKDIVTIAMTIFLIASAIFPSYTVLPWAAHVSLMSLLAYFVGYFLSTRRMYELIFTIDPQNLKIKLDYICKYKSKKDGKMKIAEKTNKGMLKRWIWGIEHDLIGNVETRNLWTLSIGHPYYPVPDMLVSFADVYLPVDPIILRKDKRIKFKKYATEIIYAPASMLSLPEMLFSMKSRQQDIRTNIRLSHQLIEEKMVGRKEAQYNAAELIIHAVTETSPKSQLDKFIASQNKEREQSTTEKKDPISKKYLIRRWKNKKEGFNNG